MKKYEAMEALKVTFNAREQVAAACGLWLDTAGDKYTNTDLNVYDECEWNISGNIWSLTGDPNDTTHQFKDGETNSLGGAGNEVLMQARYNG